MELRLSTVVLGAIGSWRKDNSKPNRETWDDLSWLVRTNTGIVLFAAGWKSYPYPGAVDEGVKSRQAADRKEQKG